MENSDARPPVRRVKCPRCHSVLEEPGAPVYQCGGCGTNLRAKNRTANTGDAVRGSPSTSRTGLPPQNRHLDSTDVATTSRSSTPTSLDATTSRHRITTDTTSRRDSGDLVSGRRHDSGDVASTSSTPTATSSRRQGTGTRSQGDLVSGSAWRHGSGDVASTSSTPTVTGSSRQGMDTTSGRVSADLGSAKRHDSGEVASTSSTPGAMSSRRQGADTTSGCHSGDLVSARDRVSEQVALVTVKRGHDQSAASPNQEVFDISRSRRTRHAGSAAELSVHFPREKESRDASSELQDDADTEKGMKRQAESPDAARKKHSGEATVQQQYQRRQEPAPKSAQAPSVQSDVVGKEQDDAAGGGVGEKAPSPSRQELAEAENLAPLRKKILKTVDELKGDLSELFRKSPELNPTPRSRPPPPGLPKHKQEGHVPRAAARALHAAKHRQVTAPPPPRGLPSRRYRRCRADPCCHSVQARSSCHHGCCHHQQHVIKPECSSCRGHCCRPTRAPEPSRKPAPAKWRPAPRNHCRPVLKGAPFIVCSSCFKLVQVPADFAISTMTVRKLRCGACSTVLSYSYRDPARKKSYYQDDSLGADQLSSDELRGGAAAQAADPFAPFVDGFGLSSYSTDDGQPLHPSRNTSFDTMDGGAGAARGVGRLHRLMGYGSASELLRHSPDLYESFSERTTPDVGHYDRKGKGVCVDDKDYGVDDDSDEEERRGGAGWRLTVPAMLGKGIPAPGAIRIK